MDKLLFNDKTENSTRLIVSDSTKTNGVKLRLSNKKEGGTSNYIVLDGEQISRLVFALQLKVASEDKGKFEPLAYSVIGEIEGEGEEPVTYTALATKQSEKIKGTVTRPIQFEVTGNLVKAMYDVTELVGGSRSGKIDKTGFGTEFVDVKNITATYNKKSNKTTFKGDEIL